MLHGFKNDSLGETQGLVAPGTRYEHLVALDQSLVRLDRYLVQLFPLYSRSFFKRLIDEGCVTVNGKQTNKQGVLLKTGERLVVSFPSDNVVEAAVVLEQTDGIRIVHIDTHFLIIDKPAGITVHRPYSGYTSPTVVDWLLLHHQEIAQIGYVDRPGIVHRLDKDTSGLMIIARTNYAHAHLSSMFKNRTVRKTYLALVEGHPPDQGSIDFPIGRHPHHRNKMAVFNCPVPQSFPQKDDRTRDALTHYRVLTRYETCSLVEVKPTTGRTHQIRVHFAALGYPLVGDLLYGHKKSAIMKRHALHAYALSFTLDGKLHEFTQDVAQDFADVVSAVAEPVAS